MAALPDIPGQIRERKRLVLGLGAQGLTPNAASPTGEAAVFAAGAPGSI